MNISISTYRRIVHVWQMLRITYGLLFLVVGVDKFFNLVVDWGKYVSPFILEVLPPDLPPLLMIVGVIEIVIGLLIFSKATRAGAYAAATFLAVIIVNLLSMGTYLDIAARDTVMAIGALALACLTTIKHEIISDN
jgi:uncharacterized membrane protein YphA (DoxX/SURF4 family)